MHVADVWGKPDLGDAYRAPIETNIRTLFSSGTLDANTSPAQADEIRRGFSKGTHLIIEYARHEDYLPNEKLQKTITAFLNGENISNRMMSQPKPVFHKILTTE